jgi:cysteine desulfurase/selenocysteine lyase
MNPTTATLLLDVKRLRAEFPLLARPVNGQPLAYLDNAATTQKPRMVLDAMTRYYEQHNANVHRGVHWLSERATEDYEAAREALRGFINAASTKELVFTRGTTEAINLVAQSWGRANLGPGDEVLITHMEHHSNIVPWQMVCAQTGATLKVAPIDDRGELELTSLERLIGPRTKLIALVHVSNALGTVNPVEHIVGLASVVGAKVLVDGAQAAPHMDVDVRELGCDFYALSAHKMYGPTGIGALWARESLLEAMPPWQGGGDMIKAVSFERTLYNDLPHRFEAGTPNVAGAVGFGAAIKWLNAVGRERVATHEARLLAHGERRLRDVPGLRLIGTARERAGVLSFVLDGAHPHDVGTILDGEGIAVRTGHHCAMPVMERFGVPATVRASLGVYNTNDELDRLVLGLARVRELLG